LNNTRQFFIGQHLVINKEGETMEKKKILISKGFFVIIVVLLFVVVFNAVGWELNKLQIPERESKVVVRNEIKSLPSLEEIRKRIKEKGYNFTVGET
jgi:hypothetical protein